MSCPTSTPTLATQHKKNRQDSGQAIRTKQTNNVPSS